MTEKLNVLVLESEQSLAANVVEPCAQEAHTVLREHTWVAACAMRAVLDRRGMDVARLVSVRRCDDALVVRIRHTGRLDDATRNMVSVRVLGALREIDHDACAIDVVFEAH